SEIISGVTNKANELIVSLLYPVVIMISSVFMLSGVVIVLIMLEPQITVVTMLVFIIFYGVTILLSKHTLNITGKTIAEQYDKVIKVVQEGLGGIRDIILDGS